MDTGTAASMIIYGVLGLIPLIYNYKAARRLAEADRSRGGEKIYVVVRPQQVDLGELEALLGGDSVAGVVNRGDKD